MDRRLDDFIDAVETVHLGKVDRWAGLVGPLAAFLRGAPFIYGVTSRSGQPRLSYIEGPSGFPVATAKIIMNDSLVRTGGFGHYRVDAVEAWQRDRPLVLSELTEDPRGFLRAGGFARHGFGECDQIRVLICDGATMRGWFGGFRGDDDPFTRAEVELFGRAVPALKRRLDLECHWHEGGLALAALEVALEAFGRPAVIADGRGRVQHPNRLARELHAFDAVAFADSIEASARGLSSEWRRHPLVTPGLQAHALWVREGSGPQTAPDSWPLSPREREVLGLVVRGLTNAAIAGHLRCSERTVEAHVARILETAQCDTRAELVATVFRSAR